MDETRWLDADEQRTWRAFLLATKLVDQTLDRQLQRDAGMPHAYYIILVALSESPGRAVRMSELAAMTNSSLSRLSHAVARLEEQGWVRREKCVDDKRGNLAVLTDDGFRVLASAAPGHVEQVRTSLFDPLTPQQVVQLREICRAVIAKLDPEAQTALLTFLRG